MLPLAEELNTVLAIEPVHAACACEWTFLTTLEEAAALIDRLDTPYLKLAFDTYHLGHDPCVVQQVASLAKSIGVVHLADSQNPPQGEQNRRCLGDGNLPLGCIIRALKQGGYDGYYDVELVGEEIETSCYWEIIERSKRVYEQLVLN